FRRSGHERGTLTLSERIEHAKRHGVRSPIELPTLGKTRLRELRAAHPTVARAHAYAHQPLTFQRAQHATQVSGVEPKSRPQRADLCPIGTDLPQHARLADRTRPPEESVVERTDPFRDRPIEAPDLCDRVDTHNL